MQLIVLGMHRSGTSVVARLLNLMGAYFGPEGASLGASTQNPKGFWERRDVIELNELLIRSTGCDWNRPLAFSVSAVPEAVLATFQERARRLLLDLDAHRPWMVKEPRFCLTLPAWSPLLEVPIGIHVVRHPVEVASSLRTRNDMPMHAGLELWDFYTRNAIAATADMPHVLVSHLALMEKPVEAVEKLLNALAMHHVAGLRMPTAREITAFISLDLYRERATREDLITFKEAPQVELYRKLITTPRQSAKLRPFVPTYGCLAAYERAVAEPLPALIEAEKTKKELAAAKATAVTEVTNRDERIKALERDVANAVAATSKQHEHVVAVEKKLQACEAWRLTAEKEVQARGEESISLRSHIRDLEGQLLHTKELLNAREMTILSLKADRDEVESRVRLREQELAVVARQIAECQDLCESHVTEVADVKSAMAQQQWSLSLAVREVLALRKTPGVWTLTQLATTDRFIRGLPSRYPLTAAASLLKGSGLFDEEWYCGQHGDVVESGLTPVLHYLCFGAARMSDPGPAFQSAAYLTANPDVYVAGANPLLHYIVHGKAEGRSIE